MIKGLRILFFNNKKGFKLSGRTLLYILAAILSVLAAFFIVPVLSNLLK